MQREASTNDGYIEISSLVKFNSIKRITTEASVIAEAAKTVPTVVVSKDGDAVRRKDPLPDDSDEAARTIFVDNVPLKDAPGQDESKSTAEDAKEDTKEDAKEGDKDEEDEGAAKAQGKKKRKTKHFTVDLQSVKSVFSAFGEIAIVRFRFTKSDAKRNVAKSALGSLFVEFKSTEGAEKALANTEDIKLGENIVKVRPLTEWLEENKAKNRKRDRGIVDKDNKDKDGEGEEKEKEKGEAGSTEKPSEKEGEEGEVEQIEWEPNCVIALGALPEGTDRESIKVVFENVDGVALDDIYVDYSRGMKDGFVRFPKTFDKIADIAAQLAKGDIKINGGTVESASVLSGDEEVNYWKQAAIQRAQRRQQKRKQHGYKKQRR